MRKFLRFLSVIVPTIVVLALIAFAFTAYTYLEVNAAPSGIGMKAPTPGGPHRLRPEKKDAICVLSVYWDDTSTGAFVFTISDTHRGRPTGYLETTWRDDHMTTSQGTAKTATDGCYHMWFDPLEYEAAPLTSGQITVYRDDCLGTTVFPEKVWGILPIYWIAERYWL